MLNSFGNCAASPPFRSCSLLPSLVTIACEQATLTPGFCKTPLAISRRNASSRMLAARLRPGETREVTIGLVARES